MKNKKILAPIVAFGAIALALASCGGGTSTESSSTGGGADSSVDFPAVDSSSKEELLPVATGAHQFIDKSYAERTEILGKLEKYAVDNAITGLPLFENSGYQMMNPRIVKGRTNYITNYGFSTIRDGYIKEGVKLKGETDDKFQNYYHTWSPSDPASINAWNADGSDISDLASNATASYFGTKLNEEKTGYVWYGVLSKDDHMLPVLEDGSVITDPTAGELHTTWRMHVRTGEAGGVAYRTASTLPERAAFDGRYVTLEDYLSAFKMLLNGANALYRGTELANKTGKGAIVGLSNYYSVTKQLGKKGINTDDKAEYYFSKSGIKGGTDGQGDYLEFTFQTPVNRFYAMYSMSSGLYQPIPADFVNLIGIENLGGYSKDKSTTPIDNFLCLGPYLLESWESEKLITFKRNDEWWERKENPNLYRIGGIHQTILPGYATDKNIAFKEFLNEKLDAAGIPSDYLKEYSSDPRANVIPGDSVFKLNLNTCDAETWEYLFGVNGTQAQTAKKDYWKVKPWMSNDNFIRGLFYSIDRATFAAKFGCTPSINYFSNDYMSNPETGESYNSTAAHRAALEDFWGDTVETNGYNAALSTEAFKVAIGDLLDEGSITETTSSIDIEIWWMYPNMIQSQGALIGGYIKTAFDAAADSLGLPVRLNVIQNAVNNAMDVYEDHLQVGQFDLGFGSISGNTLDPLNFMEVLKSSNSSGFTLNWGADTSVIAEDDTALVYEGHRWSFDTLWDAADAGVILDESGTPIDAVEVQVSSVVPTADTVTIEGTIKVQSFDGLVVELSAIFGTTDPSKYSDYFEAYPDGSSFCYLDTEEVTSVTEVVWEENGHFSIKLTGELAANVLAYGSVPVFGVDYYQTIQGVFGGLKSAFARCVLPAE